MIHNDYNGINYDYIDDTSVYGKSQLITVFGIQVPYTNF